MEYLQVHRTFKIINRLQIKNLRFMMKILFPTDFSSTANNAFIYALQLADKINAKIIVLNIATHIEDVSEELFELDATRKEGLSQLNQIAEKHQLSHVPFEFLYEKGDLLYLILELVKREEINYIVMGTKGENTLDKKVFGSNTINVVNNSPIPVLVIPADVKFKPERKFAFATLFEPYEENGLNEMHTIAQRYQTKFEVFHVENEEESYESRMKRRAWEIQHPTLEVAIIKHKETEEALVNYCENNQIDVLGIVHREMSYFSRLFKPNFSKFLINKASFALLILPSQKK